MEKEQELNERAQDALRELGNIGTGNAVTALSVMLGHSLEILSTKLNFVSYQEIYDSMGNSEEEKIGITLEAYGDIKGMFLFLLDRAFAIRTLDRLLMEKERDLADLDELEMSVFCELGNVMCGSYINALAQLLQKNIMVTVPDACMDMGGAILSSMVTHLIKASDILLMINNEIQFEKEALHGQILFFPEEESMKKISEWVEELY